MYFWSRNSLLGFQIDFKIVNTKETYYFHSVTRLIILQNGSFLIIFCTVDPRYPNSSCQKTPKNHADKCILG